MLCPISSHRYLADFARTNPLSEVAVLNLLDSLSKVHSILSLLLDRIDIATNAPGANPPVVINDASIDAVARAAAYGGCFGFSGLVLPLYRELQYRDISDATPQSERTRDRMRMLRGQVHNLAVLGGRELARGIRYLPKIHYSPTHWATTRMWAEFVAEQAEMDGGAPLSPEAARDLETYVPFSFQFAPRSYMHVVDFLYFFFAPSFADELKLLGYSLEAASTPQTFALIERLESHVNNALVAMFLPIVDAPWGQSDRDMVLHPDNI